LNHFDNQWLRGIAISADKDWRHIPILNAVARRELQLIPDIEPKYFFDHDQKIHVSHPVNMTQETLDFVLHVYDTDYSWILRCEGIIGAVPQLPVVVHSDYFDPFFDHDLPPRKPTDTCFNDLLVHERQYYASQHLWKSPRNPHFYFSVVGEEILKSIPYIRWLFIAFESSLGYPVAGRKYFFTMLMHVISLRFSIATRVFIHLVWNLIASLGQSANFCLYWTQMEHAGRVPRRARKILDNLLQNKSLSQEGLHWLILATDPFHDSEAACEGFPDVGGSRSVVQTISTTTVCGAPGAGAWDCHIFMLPVGCPQTVNAANAPQLNLQKCLINQWGAASTSYGGTTLCSGLNILAGAVSGDWTALPFSINSQCALPALYQAGLYRIIAMGFEVVDTSPDLYKQGSVTVYRTPANKIQINLKNPDGVVASTSLCSMPPSLQSTASPYPNSRTWGARDGVYSTSVLNDLRCPYSGNFPMQAGTYQTLLASQNQTYGSTTLCYLPIFSATAGTYTLGDNDVWPYDTSGAIFSGLNPNSTLQVTARYYVERVPTSSDPNLLVMGRPTPSYDPMALEIYSRAMGSLPVAVKVGENPLGEWFDSLMRVVADLAPAVGSFIPGGAAVGTLVAKAANAAADFNQGRRQHRQKLISNTPQVLNQQDGRPSLPPTRNPRPRRNQPPQIPRGPPPPLPPRPHRPSQQARRRRRRSA
jgi:hypothetical protein